jgi:tetrahydromethanopterin S-methyltransferase subunit H
MAKPKQTHDFPVPVTIGQAQIGGDPLENPPLLVPSVFDTSKHAVNKGKKSSPEQMIKRLNNLEELSQTFRLPYGLDVQGETAPDLIKNLQFITEHVNEGIPLFVDSPSLDALISAYKHVIEVGLNDRCVFNSLTHDIAPQQIEKLQAAPPKTAILSVFNPAAFSVAGNVELLQSKLLPLASKIGIQQVLIDAVILDIPSLVVSMDVITQVNALKLPAGCAPANAAFQWRDKRPDLFLKGRVTRVNAYLTGLAISKGADFVFYGSLQQSRSHFQVGSLQDALNFCHLPYSERKRFLKNRSVGAIF